MAIFSKNKFWMTALFVVLGGLIIGAAPSKAATSTSVTVTARYYAEVNDDFEVGDISLTYSTTGNNTTAGYDFVNGRNTTVAAGAAYIALDSSGKALWYANNTGQGGVVRLAKLQSIIPAYSSATYNRLGVAIVKDGVYAIYDDTNDVYIKVRVLNVAITTDSTSNTSLSTPSLIYPSNYQTFTNYPRILNVQWNAVENTHHYEVRIECNLCQGTDAWKQVGYYTSSQTTFSPLALPFDTDYRWQVRAIDASGRGGSWSGFGYFSSHTIYPALSAPILSSPTNGGVYTNSSRIVTAQWNAVNNARSYILQVECSTCGAGNWSVVNYYFPTEGSTSYPLAVTGDGNQRVRIQSIDQYGNHSPWSEFIYFRNSTTIIDPAPGLISGSAIITVPSNYATVPSSETSLNLNWTGVPNARNYRIDVSCDTCSGSNTWWHLYDTVDGVKNFALPLSDMPYGNQRYRVVVRGINLPNVGPYSSPVYFYYNRLNSNGTGTSLTQVTNLTYSLDYPGRAADVSWNAVPGATNYLVEVLCNSCGAKYGWNSYLSSYSDNGATSMRFRIPENKQYQVRVRAGNSSQVGAWSQYVTFYANAPTGSIAAPTISSASLSSSGVLSANWTSISGASQYYVVVNCIENGCAQLERGVFTGYTYLSDTQITGLSTSYSYQVRVYAMDGNSNYSQSSGSYTVRYQSTSTLATPTITSPSVNQIFTNAPRSVNFGWNQVSSATEYQLLIHCYGCGGSAGWDTVLSQTIANNYFTYILNENKSYNIQVRAYDRSRNTYSAWSDAVAFQVQSSITPPTTNIPRLITPFSQQVLTNFPRTISPRWEKIDSASRYIVEIDCDYCSSYTKWSGKPYRYVSAEYATSLNAITLPGDNEYRIRIKAVDQNGLEGPWSENVYFSFRT